VHVGGALAQRVTGPRSARLLQVAIYCGIRLRGPFRVAKETFADSIARKK